MSTKKTTKEKTEIDSAAIAEDIFGSSNDVVSDDSSNTRPHNVINIHKLSSVEGITIKKFLGNFPSPILEVLTGKTSRRIGHKMDSSDEGIEFMMEKNNQKFKYDLYFTPNGEFALGKDLLRRANLGTKFYYLILDIDDLVDSTAASEDVINYIHYLVESMPNFLVKTGKGYHIYYKLSEPIEPSANNPYPDVINLLAEKFNTKERSIIDRKCKDLSRLFRVPFTRYYKNKFDGSIKSDLLYYAPENSLDLHSLHNKIKLNQASLVSENKSVNKIKSGFNYNNARMVAVSDLIDKINELPIKDVLNRAGVLYSDCGKIFEGGKPTNGWRINFAENYVNNFADNSDRASGSPFWFIVKYLNGFNEAVEFFSSEFNLKDDLIMNTPTDIAILNDDIDSNELAKALGSAMTVDDLKIKDNRLGNLTIDYAEKIMYYGIGKEPMMQISNFLIKPVGILKVNNKDRVVIQLISKNSTSRAFFLPAEHNLAPFSVQLKREGVYTLDGSSKIIALIYSWIDRSLKKIPKLKLVTEGGLQENGDFIAGTEILLKDGRVMVIDEQTQIINNNIVNLHLISESALKNNLSNVLEDEGFKLGSNKRLDTSSFEKLLTDRLFSIYNPHKIAPILFSLINTMLSTFYKRNGHPCPHLIVWGESQSGKSTINMMLKKLLGFKYLDGNNSASTNFSVEYGVTTGFLVHLNEYRADNPNKAFLGRVMREVYDGHAIQKGNKDQGMNIYPGLSSILLEGENLINDSAVQTRSVVVFCLKEDKRTPENFESMRNDIFKDFKGINYYIIHRLQEIAKNKNKFLSGMLKHRATLEKIINKTNPSVLAENNQDRVLNNYAQMCAVADTLIDSQDVLDKVFAIFADNVIDNIKSHETYDTCVVHFNNMMTMLSNAVVKGQGDILQCIFKYNPLKHTIVVQTAMLQSFINNKRDRDDLIQTVSILQQMEYIEADPLSFTIHLKSEKIKKFLNSTLSFLQLLSVKKVVPLSVQEIKDTYDSFQ